MIDTERIGEIIGEGTTLVIAEAQGLKWSWREAEA